MALGTTAVEVKNPVTVIRERLGTNGVPASRSEIARRTNCSYALLTHVELGYETRVPVSIVEALANLGMPEEEAQRMYAAWRETLRTPPAPEPAGE